jgi:hypothetical protein
MVSGLTLLGGSRPACGGRGARSGSLRGAGALPPGAMGSRRTLFRSEPYRPHAQQHSGQENQNGRERQEIQKIGMMDSVHRIDPARSRRSNVGNDRQRRRGRPCGDRMGNGHSATVSVAEQ